MKRIALNGERVLSVKKSFRNAVDAAGLVDVTTHTLRHSGATWMAQQGVDMWQIAGYLGHTEQRTTGLYAHHSPDYLEDAKRAL